MINLGTFVFVAPAVPLLQRCGYRGDYPFIEETKALKRMRSVGVLPKVSHPMLVTFRDIGDPKNVQQADLEYLTAPFADGASLTATTVQIADNPVSTGIEKRLSRMTLSTDDGLDNDFTIATTPTLAQILGYRDFRQGALFLRRLGLLALAWVPLWATGCSAHDRLGQPAVARTTSANANGKIAMNDQSTLCISLQVDPQVWRRPVSTDLNYDFSVQFARAISELYKANSTPSLLDADGNPRIVVNSKGDNPLCRDDYDINLTASYTPRTDGKSFRFTYRVEQNEAFISDSMERDIEAEWDSGKIARIGYDPIGDALTNDIRDRARIIYLHIEQK